MKYKALMLDVDGTTIPYDYRALPSDTVTRAIKNANEKINIHLVTGRSYGFIDHILEKLEITSGLVAVNNGAQVIDIASKDFIYNRHISLSNANYIASYLFQKNIPFYIKQDTFEDATSGGYFRHNEVITSPYMIFIEEILSNDEIDTILKDFTDLPEISFNKGHHKTPNKYSFSICHGEATKLHGIEMIMKHTELTKDEIIGVGDGYNDFPLLMASGLKVAMGNAVSELKEIADVIAPGVEEDGVAWVIDNYILNSNS